MEVAPSLLNFEFDNFALSTVAAGVEIRLVDPWEW